MKTKKILALALCAVLLVCGSVLGTMAYLTAEDDVVNTFTVGNVAIKLDEAKVDEYGVAVEGADRVQENTYKLLPGHEYTKDPTVTVLKGSDKAYVRMLLTINEQKDLDAVFAPGVDLGEFFGGYESSKWVYEAVTYEGDTATYEFRYNGVVEAPAADVALDPLFKSIIIPNTLDGADLEAIADLEITVVAQAIQADGFADAAAAWAAWVD